MSDQPIAVAQHCLNAAYAGSMDFPSIIRSLMAAGFEGYDVDYRRAAAIYYLADGRHVQIALPSCEERVAAEFRAAEIERAVRAAQSKAVGYTYAGFCRQVKAAGCAGYMVSFPGRRVVYFGRTAETHVEHFPR